MDIRESNFITSEKLVPSIDESLAVFSKRIEDPSYGNIDFRTLKSSQLSNSVANKMVMLINSIPGLKAECSKDIADATQLFIKNCGLFVPNKAHNLDPAKWFMLVFEFDKYICFGKTVALDIDTNYFFEGLGLKNEKDREEKLALATEFHNAVKSRNNKLMKYCEDKLIIGWFRALLNKSVNLFTEAAHKVYWTPAAYAMLPIYEEYYGIIPASDWFFYPLHAKMIKMHSREVPNMYMSLGPPINLLKNPPYKGNLLVEIGVYLKYDVSFFGGKITLKRNEKVYK